MFLSARWWPSCFINMLYAFSTPEKVVIVSHHQALLQEACTSWWEVSRRKVVTSLSTSIYLFLFLSPFQYLSSRRNNSCMHFVLCFPTTRDGLVVFTIHPQIRYLRSVLHLGQRDYLWALRAEIWSHLKIKLCSLTIVCSTLCSRKFLANLWETVWTSHNSAQIILSSWQKTNRDGHSIKFFSSYCKHPLRIASKTRWRKVGICLCVNGGGERERPSLR